MKCINGICGDICGQPMEFTKEKIKNYELLSNPSHFTDDTVMTIAVMKWLIGGELTREKLIKEMVDLGLEYWYAGYGGSFNNWLHAKEHEPYNSWGNGSAMRVSPIGWFFNTEEEVLKYAELSAEVTHNHEEGIKGAQATAIAIYLARKGKSKEEIKEYIEDKFGYDLDRTTDEIRPTYKFEVSCQKSVPESIICFLEPNSVVEAIQLAISLGGDTDTMGMIAGSIAEAYYGTDEELLNECIKKTSFPTTFVDVIKEFNEKLNGVNTNTSNEISW